MPGKQRVLTVLLILLAALLLTLPGAAQDEASPAEIVNDEGGPVLVTGSFPISNANIITSTFEPIVILEDQTGYIDGRNFDYVLPPESQVMGAFTSPYTVGTVTYSLSLPARPQGGMNDVDNDGEDEPGVQVFQVAFWDNQYGDVFLQEYDGTGWSGSYSTASTSINPETLGEYTGGSIIVWAPDDEQGFPSGFGEDGFIFTEDDPIVILPAGYTVVNMDTDPFTFDRSEETVLDLLEPESVVPDDFSDMSYADAFNALIDKAIREYIFTEYNSTDWEALREEYLPRFEEADANDDLEAYLFALEDFSEEIPDGHVSVSEPFGILTQRFIDETDGGIGISAVETDDGRVLVNFLLEGGPADEAGIEMLAEITEVNGMSIDEAIAATQPFGTFSSEPMLRIQQLRYLLVSPVGTDYTITFQNPGADEPETVELTSVAERESFAFSSINRGRDPNAPVISYRFLENNIGYIEVNDFFGNGPLMIETWEAFISQAIALESPGIIVDIRYNGGGFSFIGNRMASYFFEEETPMYYGYGYNAEIDDFWSDERFPSELLPPLNPTLIYDGPVAVLISPACASACEFFGYALGFDGRSTYVGQYPSRAIAGGWFPTFLPEGVSFALPTSGDLDFDGNFILEGIGLVPDVKVPVDEESILRPDDDIILEAAVAFLEEEAEAAEQAQIEALALIETLDGGAVELGGDTVSGDIGPGQRIQFRLEGTEAGFQDWLIETEDATVLRVYVEGNPSPAIESEDTTLGGIEIPPGLNLIFEIGTPDDEGSASFTFRVRNSDDVEIDIVEGGAIEIGDTITGDLTLESRTQYTLDISEDGAIDILLGDEAGEVDTYLRVYIDGEQEPSFENDDIESGVQINSQLLGLEVTAGQKLVIEVGGYGDLVEGAYTLTVREAEAAEDE